MRLDGYRARQSLVGLSAHCANSYIPHVKHIIQYICENENKICANVWRPCFFGVNPTYGVLPYSIIQVSGSLDICLQEERNAFRLYQVLYMVSEALVTPLHYSRI